MSRFIHYLKDSQRGHRSCWIFSFKKPSLYQARLKQKWFFEPYRSKRISRWSKYDKFVELWFYFGYPLLSIFIDLNVLRDRYTRLGRAWDLYYDWVFTRSRWYQYWDLKLKYHALPILSGVGFYIVIQGFYLLLPSINVWYKKKVWWVFINFIWFKFIKNFLLFSFFVCFVFVKSFYFYILIGTTFFFTFGVFLVFNRFRLLFFIKNRQFEKALLVSSFSSLKYSLRRATRGVREIYKLGWRLSPSLTERFSIILNRFEEYQFPFLRQDDSNFLDFWGVEGSGWLKFESFISRLDFYNSSIPSLFFKPKYRRKWSCFLVPIRFLSIWSRRPNKRFDRFYARNSILYTKIGEVVLFKSRVHYYRSFFNSFFDNYKLTLRNSTIYPLVYRPYPWWFYRQKLLWFLYIKFMFLYIFTFYKDTAPVRGDLVSVYKRRLRNRPLPVRMFYSVNTYFTIFINSKLQRLNQFWTQNVFFTNSNLYKKFWLKLNLFLDAFSWLILLPIARRAQRKKNNLLKFSFFLTFVFLIFFLV